MDRREQLTQHAAQLDGDIRALQAAIAAENRTATPDELGQIADKNAQFARIQLEIDQLDATEARASLLSKPQPRLIQPTEPPPTATLTSLPRAGTASITGGTPVAHNYANHGFTKGAGEFLLACYRAGTDGHRDPRLMVNAVTTFGGETVGADGAFALPPQFVSGIMDAIMPADSFLRAMNPVQTNSNLLVVPKNDNPAWSTSGITSAKVSEGGAITPTKPAIGELRIPLYKAAALVHVSEESLSDIPFLSSWVMDQMGQHLRYQLENWVVNGTGEGEPLGILNSPALISLSDADSTATAIGAVDVLTMEASLISGNGAFWLANPTVFPAIATMKTGTAGYPLFQPDMTVASKQALLGRQFFRAEACPILNTTGDIILLNPAGYVLALKSGGVQTATTVGFAFDQDMQSFRATLRAGGAGLLAAKVARAKSGSSYISHFVTIAGSRS